MYDDFLCLFFLPLTLVLYVIINTCIKFVLVGELTEETDQFRFVYPACLDNLKGSVGLNLTKVSVMRVTIPIDLSTRSFIPLSRFFRCRRASPLLTSSLVLFSQHSA